MSDDGHLSCGIYCHKNAFSTSEPMSIGFPDLSAVIHNQCLILFGGKVVRHQQIML